MKDWMVPALGTFVSWGLWGFLPKITTRYITPQSAIVYEALGGVPIALVVLILLRFRPQTDPRGVWLAVVTGMIGVLGALCFLYAVSRGKVSLVVSLTALYPAMSVLLAMIFLQEQLNPRQGLGIALALVAMILVAA